MISFYLETEIMSLKEEKNTHKTSMSLGLHKSIFPIDYYLKKNNFQPNTRPC